MAHNIKKGFSATPVIFLGLFLISGILIINFSDIDRRLVEGIKNENTLHKLYSDYMENKTNQKSLLLFYSVEACSSDTTDVLIEEYVENKIGGKVKVYECNSDEKYFLIRQEYEFLKNLGQAKINKNISVMQKITCDLIKEFSDGAEPIINCNGEVINCKS